MIVSPIELIVLWATFFWVEYYIVVRPTLRSMVSFVLSRANIHSIRDLDFNR
jgi:hypothetical protein